MDKSFFHQDAEILAKNLLGCMLVHNSDEGTTSGIIVETESYSQNDAASHSFNGKTDRNHAMFGEGGHAYIYFTYGMHYCFNVVSGKSGSGQAVLIRALKPVDGIDVMTARRGRSTDLCNGPAKLVQAMAIGKHHYGKPLYGNSELFIKPYMAGGMDILAGPRVGISRAKEEPLRFWIKETEIT